VDVRNKLQHVASRIKLYSDRISLVWRAGVSTGSDWRLRPRMAVKICLNCANTTRVVHHHWHSTSLGSPRCRPALPRQPVWRARVAPAVRCEVEQPAVLDPIAMAARIGQLHQGRAKLIDHIVDVSRWRNQLPGTSNPYPTTVPAVVRTFPYTWAGDGSAA